MANLHGIPNRIVFFRREAGLSAADLARALDVSTAAVACWETGKNSPTVGNLVRIAKVLGVSPRLLIDERAGE